jgi:hypothetical protein
MLFHASLLIALEAARVSRNAAVSLFLRSQDDTRFDPDRT